MKNNGVGKLTVTQKACLRLVFLQMSSKDIAKKLGLSPHTVDNHIKTAIQRLNVGNRREASRMLAEAEGLDVRRALVDQSPELATAAHSAELLAPQPKAIQIEEDILSSNPGSGGSQKSSVMASAQFPIRLPLPHYVGEENNLSATERLAWMVVLTILICLAAGAMLAGLEALGKIV